MYQGLCCFWCICLEPWELVAAGVLLKLLVKVSLEQYIISSQHCAQFLANMLHWLTVKLWPMKTACQSLKMIELICLVGFGPINSWAHQGFTLAGQMCQVAAIAQPYYSWHHTALATQNHTHSPAAVVQPQAPWWTQWGQPQYSHMPNKSTPNKDWGRNHPES